MRIEKRRGAQMKKDSVRIEKRHLRAFNVTAGQDVGNIAKLGRVEI